VARDKDGNVKTSPITVNRRNGEVTESSRGATSVYRTESGRLIEKSQPVGQARQRATGARSTKPTKPLNNVPVNTSRPTKQTAASYAERIKQDKRSVKSGNPSQVAGEKTVLRELDRVQRVQTSSSPGRNANSRSGSQIREANDRKRTLANQHPPAAGLRNLQGDKSNYGPANPAMPNRKAGASESRTKVTKSSVVKSGPNKGTISGGDVKLGARGELGTAKVNNRPGKYDKNGKIMSSEAEALRKAVKAAASGKLTKAQLKLLIQSQLDLASARARRALNR
jgi:hypothetical protein